MWQVQKEGIIIENRLIPLGDDLYYFDLFELGQPWHTSAYLYNGKKKILIETGASPSHQKIVQALRELALSLVDLDYVILTHIHLDHAGGAGLLATKAPQAKFLCHPRAKRHLVDPTKLEQSAQLVYGDAMDLMFGEILPISADRVFAQEDGTTIRLGDRTLHFIDSPGHAKHHMCIFDPEKRVVFSGDALGIRYLSKSTNWGFDAIFPSTSPTDFDPQGVHYTVSKIAALKPRTVLHTHFGPSDANEALESTLRESMLLATLADETFTSNPTEDGFQEALTVFYQQRLQALGHNAHVDISKLGIDLMLNSLGLLYYEKKKHTLA